MNLDVISAHLSQDRVRDLERDLASRDREIADLSGSSKQARLHELQTQVRVGHGALPLHLLS